MQIVVPNYALHVQVMVCFFPNVFVCQMIFSFYVPRYPIHFLTQRKMHSAETRIIYQLLWANVASSLIITKLLQVLFDLLIGCELLRGTLTSCSRK